MSLSPVQIRWFRLRRSGLNQPFESSEAAARELAGVQAQILPAAALSLWNRTSDLTFAQFQSMLYQERSLVKLWGQRGTLHLYPSSEWPLIYGALRTRKTWWERSVEKRGGDVANYRATVAQIGDLLRQNDTMGRSDLRAADLGLAEEFYSAWGGIFADLVSKGLACHAEPVGSEGRFAHRENWLPDLAWEPPANDAANIELARRYFATYGPATVQDFTYWRGAKAADGRRWVAALQDELTDVTCDGQSLLLRKADLVEAQETPPPPDAWPVRMLYRFDPLLLTHKDKSWLINMDYYKQVWRAAGHIEGTVLDHGRIVATWRYDRKAAGISISVFPFEPLAGHVQTAIQAIAPRIAQFFDDSLTDLTIEK